MNVDKCHLALLNLAEEFRTKQPPDLKSCIQCLLAILNLPVAPYVIARTNYQIGALIHRHTFDSNIAQTYLEKAYDQAQTPDLIFIRLQSVALLVEIYLAQNQRTLAKQLLTRSINETTTSGGGHYNLYWHYRFLLALSHLNLEDGEYVNANSQLSIGAQTAGTTNDLFTRALFLLSKSMVLMIAKKYPNSIMQQPHLQQVSPEQQLVDTMAAANQILETWQSNQAPKETLKVFYLVIQVSHFLNKGHNKTNKPWLKLLHQSIQNLTNLSGPEVSASEGITCISDNMSDNFHWMPKEQLYVLVYLISALHSMQAGCLDKAQNYAEKGLVQIERLRPQSPRPDYLLESFEALLLEHMSMCHLVTGNRIMAIKQSAQAIELCYRSTNQKLRIKHRGIIRTILGFYAMSMSMIDRAENHFTRVMNDNDLGTDIRVMAMFNLALCYLQDNIRRHERRHEVEALLNRLNPEQLNSLSYYLKASAYHVYGLKAFFDSREQDAKKNLRETLKMANAEDLNRVTSCSLVLLGKIFNELGHPRESLNMVSPALKLAERMGDVHVQLWASSVLRDIYARDVNSQHHIEAATKHESFMSRFNEEKLQAAALPEHRYVDWIDW